MLPHFSIAEYYDDITGLAVFDGFTILLSLICSALVMISLIRRWKVLQVWTSNYSSAFIPYGFYDKLTQPLWAAQTVSWPTLIFSNQWPFWTDWVLIWPTSSCFVILLFISAHTLAHCRMRLMRKYLLENDKSSSNQPPLWTGWAPIWPISSSRKQLQRSLFRKQLNSSNHDTTMYWRYQRGCSLSLPGMYRSSLPTLWSSPPAAPSSTFGLAWVNITLSIQPDR